MPTLNSIEVVAYRKLGFLGFPDYRVGDDGSVWTRRRRVKFTVSEETAAEIRCEYETGRYTQVQLANKYDCGKSTVGNIVNNIGRRKVEWYQLKQLKEKPVGYMRVTLSNSRMRKQIHTHRLVLLAFVGPCPEGMECRHFPDRDPGNNRLENLQWGTMEEQYQDKVFHGTHSLGQCNPNAKLNEDEAREILTLHASKAITVRRIAERFRVSVPTVEALIYGRTWRSIRGDGRVQLG